MVQLMKEIRRSRLKELLETRFNGSRTAMWKAAGLSSARLTQLLDENEPFGDIAAENLERSLSLPRGYLNGDAPPEKPRQEGQLSAAATELALLFDLIPENDRLRRAAAHAAATQAILGVLQPHGQARP